MTKANAASPLLLLTLLMLAGCGAPAESEDAPQAATESAPAADPGATAGAEASDRPYVAAGDPVQAGRYLAIVGGCNDCHTHGYLQSEGNVPEEEWLTGSSLGWRGPWGTTYSSNLRLRVQALTEDQWVEQLHTRQAMPPMPWMNVNQMSERDARSLYRYIQHLGPAGEPAPRAVPPGQEPSTPYISLEPRNLPPGAR